MNHFTARDRRVLRATCIATLALGLPLSAFAQLLAVPAFGASPSSSLSPASSSSVSAATATTTTTTVSAAAATNATPVAKETLLPIVITADRSPQPITAAIPQTTQFDAQDIADSTASDLPGILALAPGVQVSTDGAPGSVSSLFLRGASSQQSLVLIDGVRVDSVSLGSAQISQIPLDQIDHIEVVNGNVSALYGSGAIGGVVQVFTKTGSDDWPPRFNFSTGYGDYHTQTQQAGVSGALDKEGDTTFSVSLARTKTDGFTSINPALAPMANPDANGYLDESISASLQHRFNDKWDAGIRYFQSNGNDSYDNAYGLPTDLNNLYSRIQQASVYANGKITDWWTTHLTAALGNDRNVAWLNGAYTDHFNTDNRQYTWQNDFVIAPQQKFQLGYEHLDQSLDSDEYSMPQRHVNSGFAGYSGQFGLSEIQANIRRDQYSDFGGANSYYLGYGFNFDRHWKATASWSDAFRAPTFNDLYYPDYGNPLIRPERSHSVEAGVQYASGALGLFRVNLFQTHYSDLIESEPTPIPWIYAAQNVGRAKVQGLEGSWVGHIGKTDVRASFTFQNPVDEDDDTDLDLRARRFASFSVNRNIGDLRVGGEWFLSSARTEEGERLGGYGVVNLSARYDFTKSWYVSAQLLNLFNKNYELAYTYNTPRRGVYVTLGWQQQ